MRFWASDHHVNHDRIIGFASRPFDTLEIMAKELRRRHNERVGPDDEVWFLGDVAMGDRALSVPVFKDFNGKKFLLPGNHDNLFRGGKKNWKEWEPLYEDAGFTILYEEYPGAGIPVELGGHEAIASHFPPFNDDRHGTVYSAWIPDWDPDMFYIHGHTHAKEKIDRYGRCLHIGVDAWNYYPVSDDELLALVGARKVVPMGDALSLDAARTVPGLCCGTCRQKRHKFWFGKNWQEGDGCPCCWTHEKAEGGDGGHNDGNG